MSKKTDYKKLAAQMNINGRKSIEERGTFPRPTVFTDRKKEARKKMCRKKIMSYQYA